MYSGENFIIILNLSNADLIGSRFTKE